MNSWLIGKDSDAGKDWRQKEKRATEDEMVGWCHQFNRHELGQTLGDGEGQRSLVCFSPWGCEKSDITWWQKNSNIIFILTEDSLTSTKIMPLCLLCRLFVTPWILVHQVPLSMEFSRQEQLEWVANSFSRGSSQPRDQTHISCMARGFFIIWATREERKRKLWKPKYAWNSHWPLVVFLNCSQWSVA